MMKKIKRIQKFTDVLLFLHGGKKVTHERRQPKIKTVLSIEEKNDIFKVKKRLKDKASNQARTKNLY